MAFGMDVGMEVGHIVLDGDPASLPKKGAQPLPPIFGPFYCGRTAGCIKMPLGMEVGLSPVDFVLGGDPDPYPYRGGTPNFRSMSIAAKRLHGSRCHFIGTEVGLGPGDTVLDRDRAPPPQKGRAPSLVFGPCLL